jgi:hypothetical protein
MLCRPEVRNGVDSGPTDVAARTPGRLGGCMGKTAVRNRIFHQARIAGMTLEGVMSGSGPSLSHPMNGGVALGVSGLRASSNPRRWDHAGLRLPAGGW